jgi:NDP-sugar pyrophosphorylase family protein
VNVYGGHVAIISARASDGVSTTVNSCCDVRDKVRVTSVGIFDDSIYIHNALTRPHTIAQENIQIMPQRCA